MTNRGATIALESVHEKTNEIPVFQEIFTYLNAENKTVTANAMHCQWETCFRIIIPITLTFQGLSKELAEINGFLFEDGIIHTEISKETAASKHYFVHQWDLYSPKIQCFQWFQGVPGGGIE